MATVASGIKKTMVMRFRNFSPREIDRLTAIEAFEQVTQSFGIIGIWHSELTEGAKKQNQRLAFVMGLANGLDIPFLLLARDGQRLPLDLDEFATRFKNAAHIRMELKSFREQVLKCQSEYIAPQIEEEQLLSQISCGDPAAENEMVQLGKYFLETQQFRKTLNGESNIITGRKGSGKSAIFLQTRNIVRSNRDNIVVDLAPQGFQLIRLKEFVTDRLNLGARKEFISAFWEYIVWLELASKLLEKDEKKAVHNHQIAIKYEKLKKCYISRVEGAGDFSQRLLALTERIMGRFAERTEAANPTELVSSEILEVVYGSEISELKSIVIDYLLNKGTVLFLFDNLDRFWTPSGFTEIDAQIIVGLVECLQHISRQFSKNKRNFHWVIFLRSDVYEFVVKGMADYGKLAADSIEWNDRELLLKLFQNRFLRGINAEDNQWGDLWHSASVPNVDGQKTEDFLLNASLGRPRYLIRMFETARRRAVALGKTRIDQADYSQALEELGWQVLEDFDRELSDVVPDAQNLLFNLSHMGPNSNIDDFESSIKEIGIQDDKIREVIDILLWTGCIGVQEGEDITYISDCGFRRQFMTAKLKSGSFIVFHPTLASIFG